MNEILFTIAMALIFVALCGICFAVSQVNETLLKVLQRWAALDNLALTPDARAAILQSEIDELKEGLDPALFRVLDRNQHWRDARDLKDGPTFSRPSDLSDPQMGEGRHG